MTRKKPPTTALTPQEYRQSLSQVDLNEIFLEECSAKLRRDLISQSMEISIKDKTTCSRQEDNHLAVEHRYELTTGPGRKKDCALKVLCVYRLEYTSEAPLSDEFLEVFRSHNVPLNTWPYFREFVQNMTQRMNLPPLTLPLMKS
jgi:hypothetical protein